ncbi:hypothetical protein LCGC14_0463780 [marine sediment metagenome]|uniref:Glycosyltransferase 2-like domain-containing protein n=1 Tax=marine sediment metagenome TaxID=412755 RepID=A0A0F9SEA2_9ZZZZ
MSLKLTVLIPAIPSRWEKFQKIYNKLDKQATKDVEVLGLIDNKKRSIGAKRDALKILVNGEYMCFVDDDDDVSDDFIKEILKGMKGNPDVIVFKQRAIIGDMKGIIDFDLKNHNEQFTPNKVTKRKPFICCAWKSSLGKRVKFPDLMYGEDSGWLKPLWQRAKTQYKIDKILHTYIFDPKITEAK